MQQKRMLLSVTAVILALIAGLAAYSYMHNKQKHTDQSAAVSYVYTVTTPISRGTPGSAVISGNVVTRSQMPTKYVPSDAVTNLPSIQNEVAAVSLAPGAVLESGSFMSPTALSAASASAVAKSIPTGDVAITVSISSLVNRVAGLIQPGDQVDMLIQPPATSSSSSGSSSSASTGTWQYLYQNVDVLAVGPVYSSGDATTQATNPAAAAADATVITFAVPADAAARILAASSHGLYLALVPPGNVASAQPPINSANLIPASITPS